MLTEDMAEKLDVQLKRRGSDAVIFYGGNMILGAIAASIFWLAYGPYSSTYLIGQGGTTPQEYGVTAASLASGFFIGIGAIKWLQSERDKGKWQTAAQTAARAPKDTELAENLNLASADQAPSIAEKAAKGG